LYKRKVTTEEEIFLTVDIKKLWRYLSLDIKMAALSTIQERYPGVRV
jgi:hypothetical protein